MARSRKTFFDHLCGATGIERKRNEDLDKFKVRLMSAVDVLKDDKFDELPEDVQDFTENWLQTYNGEKKGKPKGTLLEIPGLEEEGDEPEAGEKPARGRRGAKAKDPEPDDDDDDDDDKNEEEEEEEEKKPTRGRRRAAKDEEEEEEKAPAKAARGKAPAKPVAKAPAKAAANGKAAPAKAKPAAKKAEPKERGLRREGAIYNIKTFLIKKPRASVEDIEDEMKRRKVEVTTSTVTGIRSDFLNSLRILDEAEKLQDMPAL